MAEITDCSPSRSKDPILFLDAAIEVLQRFDEEWRPESVRS